MKTVVLGASPNRHRAAYQAVDSLVAKGHEVYPLGIRKSTTARGLKIINDRPEIEDVHTLTLYLNPQIQEEYFDYILETLKPKRIIFNPGTENPLFIQKIRQNHPEIEIEIACTLVMLSLGHY
jgi:predicted CoA-binding protein